MQHNIMAVCRNLYSVVDFKTITEVSEHVRFYIYFIYLFIFKKKFCTALIYMLTITYTAEMGILFGEFNAAGLFMVEITHRKYRNNLSCSPF
jgi:hypothetical protein